MLDELERLERAATPAPIGIDRDGEIFPLNAAGEFVIEGEIAAMCSDNPNDGPLFVQGRNALPALLRAIKAGREWEQAQRTYVGLFEASAYEGDVHQAEIALNRAEDVLRAALAALEEKP